MATYRKQKNGNWYVEVCVKGIRKGKTFDSKTKAKNWVTETEYQLGRQAEGVSPTHTMADIFDRYADEVSSKKKGAQWELVRLKRFKRESLAPIKLVDIRREHIERWVDDRLKTVKPSSVNRELNLISHCLTQARRWRLMSDNPMDDLKRPKDPPHRDRRITDDEVKRILVCLNYSEEFEITQKQQSAGAAFLFALETAMRAGEICGIHANHIDMTARTVFLPDTKNGLPRNVPLSGEAVRILERLQPWPEGEPVFGLKPGALSTTFREAVARAGINDLKFHDSRHEAITRLAPRLDVLDLARMTGHRDIKQLLTYYNKSASDLAKQLD